MFWENELYIPDIYLDGVVCVVDAKNVLRVGVGAVHWLSTLKSLDSNLNQTLGGVRTNALGRISVR